MAPFVRFWPGLAAVALFVTLASVIQQAKAESGPAERLDRLETELAAAQNKLQVAQGYRLPPGDVGDGGDYDYGRPQPDSAGITVRIDRLENQMRQFNGQIEQLQFETRKLSEQLRKFQEDVDFRFQDVGGRGGTPGAGAPKPLQKRGDASDGATEPEGEGQRLAGQPASPAPPAARPNRRSDAFDPVDDPYAPGAPRQLGAQTGTTAYDGRAAATTRSTQARAENAAGDPDAPLDLTGGKLRSPQEPPAAAQPTTGYPPAQGNVTPGGTVIAGLPANPAKEEFDLALGYYRQKEYENAEKEFAAFLQKNPKSKMASDATYYLGESYFQRGRPREAAEQYLKISTQYASSARAPEALLRLGQSLNSLGAKEQACATFSEISRRYPNASAAVKAGAEREAKRAQC